MACAKKLNVHFKRGMPVKIEKVRGALYKTAKVLGDVQAVKKKKVAQRVIRRAAGKAIGSIFKKLFK